MQERSLFACLANFATGAKHPRTHPLKDEICRDHRVMAINRRERPVDDR